MSDFFKSMEEIERAKHPRKDYSDLLELLKNTLVMVVIALVAGGLLGIVHEITKEPIARQELKAVQDAYRKAFPSAASFSESFMDSYAEADLSGCPYEGADVSDCLAAYDGEGNTLGYVLKVVAHEGYGGDIELFVGIANDASVNAVSIGTINETAGLGMNASSVLLPQFAGRKADAFEVVKNGAQTAAQIDAISGATKTSNAVTKGVNLAIWYYMNICGGAYDEQ